MAPASSPYFFFGLPYAPLPLVCASGAARPRAVLAPSVLVHSFCGHAFRLPVWRPVPMQAGRLLSTGAGSILHLGAHGSGTRSGCVCEALHASTSQTPQVTNGSWAPAPGTGIWWPPRPPLCHKWCPTGGGVLRTASSEAAPSPAALATLFPSLVSGAVQAISRAHLFIYHYRNLPCPPLWLCSGRGRRLSASRAEAWEVTHPWDFKEGDTWSHCSPPELGLWARPLGQTFVSGGSGFLSPAKEGN